MRLFIGGSMHDDISKKYIEDCDKYLDDLFSRDNDLVFGARNSGIMGLAYEKALKYGRKIIGACPEMFKSDLDGLNCDEEILTQSIIERTEKLIEESDALIFLPGGIGSMHEFFTMIEGRRSGEFSKPIIIYNSCGYFDKLLNFFDEMYKQGFITKLDLRSFHVSSDFKDTLEYMNNYND